MPPDSFEGSLQAEPKPAAQVEQDAHSHRQSAASVRVAFDALEERSAALWAKLEQHAHAPSTSRYLFEVERRMLSELGGEVVRLSEAIGLFVRALDEGLCPPDVAQRVGFLRPRMREALREAYEALRMHETVELETTAPSSNRRVGRTEQLQLKAFLAAPPARAALDGFELSGVREPLGGSDVAARLVEALEGGAPVTLFGAQHSVSVASLSDLADFVRAWS